VVFPACILNYLGQGALLLGPHPTATGSPFFLLLPAWGQLPMVLLATVASVIASQAVITGAYSVTHQAISLGYLPRLHIVHTSEERIGQIYVPWINWVLLGAVLVLVFAFRTSTGLASAYGVAVTGTITITTLLFFTLMRERWRRPPWLLAIPAGALLSVEVLFLAANLTKIAHGAWLPLLTGIATFTVLTTWQRGRAIVTREREREEGTLASFISELDSGQPTPLRVPGTGVFLSRGVDTAPLALRAHVERLHILPEHVIICTVSTLPMPHVANADRLTVEALGRNGDAVVRVTVQFGYKDVPDVPRALERLDQDALAVSVQADTATYFLSKIELGCGAASTMARWRKRLFLATSAITADAAEHFRLPRTRTVIIGSLIDV
jgi:KUP system potassium uptake protein